MLKDRPNLNFFNTVWPVVGNQDFHAPDDDPAIDAETAIPSNGFSNPASCNLKANETIIITLYTSCVKLSSKVLKRILGLKSWRFKWIWEYS
jgi:hypothetical protein